MWNLPRPGLKPMSPALAGRFLTTEPPGKPSPFLAGVDLSPPSLGIWKHALSSPWATSLCHHRWQNRTFWLKKHKPNTHTHTQSKQWQELLVITEPQPRLVMWQGPANSNPGEGRGGRRCRKGGQPAEPWPLWSLPWYIGQKQGPTRCAAEGSSLGLWDYMGPSLVSWDCDMRKKQTQAMLSGEFAAYF